MKSEKELNIARSEFIKSFNFVVGILRMNGLSRKIALGLALMALIGGGASIRNASITFRLNYANLLKALENLENTWRDYLEVLSKVIIQKTHHSSCFTLTRLKDFHQTQSTF